MADKVAESQFAPRVFDVRPERGNARVEHGAVSCSSVVEAATGADVACVVVHDDDQVLEVVDRSFLDALSPDGIVVLHSTVTLETVHTVQSRCESTGRHLVDMGISGGVTGAKAGSLFLIAGGPLDVIERVKPVVDCYSREMIWCGEVGAGMVAKAARNLIALCVMAAVSDGAALAKAAGVAQVLFAEIVRKTAPMGHGQRLLDGSMLKLSGSALDEISTTGAKDLAVAIRLAEDLGIDVPAATAAYTEWDRVVGLVAGGETV